MLTFPPVPNNVRHPPQGHGELRKSTFFFGGKNSTDWLFSNPPNSPRTLPVHDVIHIPRSYFAIWDFYFDISDWHILPSRAWTPALMLHLTNPCAKRKVLSLTKPKSKIYKTKSLGHYITAREEDKSTWEPVKYGKFVCQFQPDIKTTIQWFDRIETKICRLRLSVIFNYIYICVCVCLCVCANICYIISHLHLVQYRI